MPMNARLLNVGLLLLTVGLAGCTSTTPEASSARQDEASIAASPVATSSEASSFNQRIHWALLRDGTRG
jgi:outer membrane PBP1 activator LpoA protein